MSQIIGVRSLVCRPASIIPVPVAVPGNAVNITYTFPSIGALIAAPVPSLENVTARVLGYHVSGDCGLPLYRWSATSSLAHNDGTILKPTSAGPSGRWIAVVTEGIYFAEWFGCRGDNGVTDNAASLQQAVSAAIAAEISTLMFGAGRFYYTTPFVIPVNKQLSVIGQGADKTYLLPVNHHGITINNNNTEGVVVVISGIHFYCSGANYCGIYAPGTAESIGDGTRLYGYVIEKCTFTNCGVGVYIGFGQKIVIQNNGLSNCYYGIVFRGQCIACIAKDNHLFIQPGLGNSPPVSLVPVLQPGGGSQGIWVGARDYAATYIRSEDVKIKDNWTFGYSIGCTIFDCLYSVVESNDFDYCSAIGIFFNSVDGGTRILNNWIGMDSRAAAITAGISSNTVANTNTNLATIRDNHIAVVGTVAGGVGIRILYNAYEGTIVEGNSIDCDILKYGIFFDRVKDGAILHNRIYGSLQPFEDYIVCSFCTQTTISGNQISGRPPFLGNCSYTKGNYFLNGLGSLKQDGTVFTFFDGIYRKERVGLNDGDINLNALDYKIVGGTLPISPTGLLPGSYWVDPAAGQVLKVVP